MYAVSVSLSVFDMVAAALFAVSLLGLGIWLGTLLVSNQSWNNSFRSFHMDGKRFGFTLFSIPMTVAAISLVITHGSNVLHTVGVIFVVGGILFILGAWIQTCYPKRDETVFKRYTIDVWPSYDTFVQLLNALEKAGIECDGDNGPMAIWCSDDEKGEMMRICQEIAGKQPCAGSTYYKSRTLEYVA